ncbi:flagellar hook-length control protein FliK [Dechloromonas denitrificans]|uniref:flagellar hook-length control protein FliK n=1 Tax=Dechloromonas denitrificans TaxID=281362 RepID=UPI001CF8B547|nr:flagellar hook-length control protein FliK [Dechloromonas denitrificans]UCV04567.1 flagellar hook-length control protein FliK [Dechloromonas denitrificans]UCV08896.1 flagellar hook-length control protein FliK [Dechloromonas denitrificans]
MIPPDVASSLRQILPDQHLATGGQTQPVPAAQRIADALSDLVPGQRIFAEILAVLPNGTYRATVAQRDVTLALPFAAKPGDSLELEVAESDGKVTLAVVANRSDAAVAKNTQESVTTSLSSAGKMIGNLLNGLDGEGKRAPPAPLNGNQALVETMPKMAADLAPVLKQALAQSGMFYEAHQARWVSGDLPTDALRQEPQGKHSTPQLAAAPGAIIGEATKAPLSAELGSAAPRSEQATLANQNIQTSSPVPNDLRALVQQQLDGLATQSFAWQGQVWPGQKMWWEIAQAPEDGRSSEVNATTQWQTRLKLSLPALGGIDITLALRPGGNISVSANTESETSESRLRDSAEQLRQQFEAAGLNLSQLLVLHGQPAE